MKCAWEAFVLLLPVRYRSEVDRFRKAQLIEVRMRLGLPPELVFTDQKISLCATVTTEDLKQCIHYASQYSPWTAETIRYGYITAPGGHRIGVFGRFCENGDHGWTLQTPTMLCLRVARDFDGIASGVALSNDSVLVIGAPGLGKTTLLRDLIRSYSKTQIGNICVIDEREEIFPRYRDQFCFFPGGHTDVLSGCKKQVGIEWALRNMTPSVIAVDEITAEADCEALLHAGWCGVKLFATAHAGCMEDLLARPVYKEIIDHKLFQTLLIMQPDRTWKAERI